MPQLVIELAGWLPGIIYPGATLLQLIKLCRSRTAKGVSISTWALFAVANVGLYIFTQKYWSLQSIVGLLGTAMLDIIIVVVAIALARKDRP